MRGKLLDYQKNHKEDLQIRDLLIILDIFTMEIEFGDYEAAYEKAEPIFERLSQVSDWDFCDIRIFAALIDCCSLDFDEIDLQAETALTKLEEYSHEERYPYIKSAIHMNILFRLLRVRFLEIIDIQNKALVKRLESTFLKHYDAIHSQDGFHTRKAVALVRKGAFFKDESLIDEGYEALEDLKEYKWVESLEQELDNYVDEEKHSTRKRKDNEAIGRNLEKARLASGISKQELADSLRMTAADITLVEAGRKRLSYSNMRIAADALMVTYEYFISGNGDSINKVSSEVMLERKALTEGHIELTKMLSNEEMRFTAGFMKFLMEDRSEYSTFFKKQSLWLD